MLKQEEALAELDSSIDEWVNKLERAENRRTRVRQKLLEHVAAATTLATPTVATSESPHLPMGVRPLNAHNLNLSTPPRSPVKTSFTPTHASPSPSPQRVVAQVPSTILEQPLFEEAASMSVNEVEAMTSLRRAETIRVYADDGVYALLADVEDTITKMSSGDLSTKEVPLPEAERKKLFRTRSHDVLSGSPARKPLPISKLDEKKSCSSLTTASTPPAAEPASDEIFLTSAVFKP
jgi:hypothetical protein